MNSTDRLEEAHATFAELTAAFEDASAMAAEAQAVSTLMEARQTHVQLADGCEHISALMLRLKDLLQ